MQTLFLQTTMARRKLSPLSSKSLYQIAIISQKIIRDSSDYKELHQMAIHLNNALLRSVPEAYHTKLHYALLEREIFKLEENKIFTNAFSKSDRDQFIKRLKENYHKNDQETSLQNDVSTGINDMIANKFETPNDDMQDDITRDA